MDPELFPEPREFRPERFLGDTDDIPNPRELVFGFGRRYAVYSPLDAEPYLL
jgi:cytochrome P450